jgi:cell division protease FtsH
MPGDRTAPQAPMPPRRTWMTFLIILAVNFVVVRFLFPGGDAPLKVPYTLFKQEVTKGNVARIYSRGESLTGTFRNPVTYPAAPDTATGTQPRTGTAFATTLPAFVDPGLEGLLIANGAEISAEPIQGRGNPRTFRCR